MFEVGDYVEFRADKEKIRIVADVVKGKLGEIVIFADNTWEFSCYLKKPSASKEDIINYISNSVVGLYTVTPKTTKFFQPIIHIGQERTDGKFSTRIEQGPLINTEYDVDYCPSDIEQWHYMIDNKEFLLFDDMIEHIKQQIIKLKYIEMRKRNVD